MNATNDLVLFSFRDFVLSKETFSLPCLRTVEKHFLCSDIVNCDLSNQMLYFLIFDQMVGRCGVTVFERVITVLLLQIDFGC